MRNVVQCDFSQVYRKTAINNTVGNNVLGNNKIDLIYEEYLNTA